MVIQSFGFVGQHTARFLGRHRQKSVQPLVLPSTSFHISQADQPFLKNGNSSQIICMDANPIYKRDAKHLLFAQLDSAQIMLKCSITGLVIAHFKGEQNGPRLGFPSSPIASQSDKAGR